MISKFLSGVFPFHLITKLWRHIALTEKSHDREEEERAQLFIKLCMTSIEVDVGYIGYRLYICVTDLYCLVCGIVILYSVARRNHLFATYFFTKLSLFD